MWRQVGATRWPWERCCVSGWWSWSGTPHFFLGSLSPFRRTWCRSWRSIHRRPQDLEGRRRRSRKRSSTSPRSVRNRGEPDISQTRRCPLGKLRETCIRGGTARVSPHNQCSLCFHIFSVKCNIIDLKGKKHSYNGLDNFMLEMNSVMPNQFDCFVCLANEIFLS